MPRPAPTDNASTMRGMRMPHTTCSRCTSTSTPVPMPTRSSSTVATCAGETWTAPMPALSSTATSSSAARIANVTAGLPPPGASAGV